MRDLYRNYLITGGGTVELAMFCVARYGAVEPYAINTGNATIVIALPSYYHHNNITTTHQQHHHTTTITPPPSVHFCLCFTLYNTSTNTPSTNLYLPSPHTHTSGTASGYYYKGFYSGDPSYPTLYGTILDQQNGVGHTHSPHPTPS